MQLLKKDINDEKYRLFEKQNGICKLCNNPLEKPVEKNHLDHDHALCGENAGRVRGLLCVRCNPLEGHIKHKFNSSGLVRHGVDYIEWLEKLLSYLKDNYSDYPYHPNFINDKAKEFSKLNLPDMKNVLEEYNWDWESEVKSPTKANLVKYFKKQFKKYQCLHNN